MASFPWSGTGRLFKFLGGGSEADPAVLAVAVESNGDPTTAGATKDAGTAYTVTRTYTTSADMSTAAAISPAPSSGEKLYAMDVFMSTDTAGRLSLQEETSATVFASGFFPANCGIVQLTPRGEFKTAVADKKFFGKHSVAGNVAFTVITRSGA